MRVAVVGIVWAVSIALCGAIARGEGRTVQDGAGRTVQVPSRPERIVSLAPSVTEMLFAVGAGGRVVGVTDFCSHPPEAASRTRIGGMIHPDLERIAGLAPDLVVATTSGNDRADVERIERLGPPVYTIHTPTLEAVLRTLGRLGELVGSAGTARRLVQDLRARIDRVRSAAAALPRLRTLFVIEPDPLIVPGRGTFLGEALAVAGAELATAGAAPGWSPYDIEQVIAAGPEVILVPEAHAAWTRTLESNPAWRKVPAVPAGRVYVVSDAVQHPGPRLVDGIEEVAGILARAAAGLELRRR